MLAQWRETARQFQNRADKYAWPGSLPEVAVALALAKLFPLREAGRSISLQVSMRSLSFCLKSISVSLPRMCLTRLEKSCQ